MTFNLDVSLIIPACCSPQHLEDHLYRLAEQEDLAIQIIVLADANAQGINTALDQFKRRHPEKSVLLLPPAGEKAYTHAIADGALSAGGEFSLLLEPHLTFSKPSSMKQWLAHARGSNCDLCVSRVNDRNACSVIRHDRPKLEKAPPSGSSWSLLDAITTRSQVLFRTSNFMRGAFNSQHIGSQPCLVSYFLQATLHTTRLSFFPGTTIKTIPARSQTDLKSLSHSKHNEYYLKTLDEKQKVNKFNICKNNLLYLLFFELLNLEQSFSSKNADVLSKLENESKNIIYTLASKLCVLLGELALSDCANTRYSQLGTGIKFTEFHYDLLIELAGLRQWRLAAALASSERLTFAQLYSVRHLLNSKQNYIASRYLSFDRDRSLKSVPVASPSPMISREHRPRLVLHVGTPKTGSSSLQNALVQNRFALLEHGVCVPMCGWHQEAAPRAHRTAGHYRLIKAAVDGCLEYRDILRHEIDSLPSTPKQIVLTAENTISHLLWRGEDGIRRIAEYFEEFEVEVFGVFREHDAWLASWYREMFSNPKNDFCSSPVEAVLSLHDMGLLDYPQIKSCFEREFGTERCRFLDYQDIVDTSGGIIAAFGNFLGLTFQLPHTVPAAQKNHSDETLLIATLLMKLWQVPKPYRVAIAHSDFAKILSDLTIETVGHVDHKALFAGVSAIIQSNRNTAEQRNALSLLLSDRRLIANSEIDTLMLHGCNLKDAFDAISNSKLLEPPPTPSS